MKISIIVPIYNIEDCLERCVKSIINQTFRDIEIILVDDGSTDGTPELVDRLAKLDERIVVFHKENGGSSSARNLGIANASGEYLGFVDSDDYISEDMYEKLLGCIEENHLKVAQICRDEIASDGSKLPNVIVPSSEYTEISSDDFLKELLLHRGDCSFCTKLISRDLFSIGVFPEGELNEDFWLFAQMLLATDASGERILSQVGILPDTGYHVYYRENSNTRTVSKDVFPRVFTDIVVNADRIEKLIDEKFPELEEHSRRFSLIQRLDYMLHIPISQMNGENEFYIQVKDYLKKHKSDIKNNTLLKEEPGKRKKLLLLATAPKLTRQVHMFSMKLRGIR